MTLRSIRSIHIVLIGFLLAGGLLAAIFSHSIEGTLTVQSTHALTRSTPVAGLSTPTVAQATATSPVPSPVPGFANELVSDTFQRADQPTWGTASDGRKWVGDAFNQAVFSIVNHKGQITGGQGNYTALLNSTSAGQNVEVILRGKVSHFANTNTQFGAVLRWIDSNNWYGVSMDGAHLVILKRENGTSTILLTQPFYAQENTFYTLRFRAIGATLFAKVWESTTGTSAEPSHWSAVMADTAFTMGLVGIHVTIQPNVVMNITSFQATTASSST